MKTASEHTPSRYLTWVENAVRKLQTFFRSEEWSRFKRIYKESTPVALITVIVEIIAGLELLRVSEYYILLPGLLLITPGLMEARGNIVTSLAKRLGSSVHLGLVDWDLGINDEIKVNFLATIYLNIILSIALALMAYVGAILLGMIHMTLWGFLFIALMMAIVVGSFLSILTVLVVLLAHRYGLDPDNVTIPIVATLGDILTIGFLFAVIRMTLFLDRYVNII